MRKLLLFKHSKWRYGGYALAVTAIVIALAVLVNLGFSELETKYGWRKDLSFNNLTTQSETTRSVLSALPFPVHIYALYTPGGEDPALVELLNRYRASSPLISYEMLELNKNPGLLARFQGNAEASLTANSLVVSCEATGRYKILSPESFSTVGYTIETANTGWSWFTKSGSPKRFCMLHVKKYRKSCCSMATASWKGRFWSR